MKEKNVGIELLRSVSMIMVVTLHVLNAGGILDCADRSTYYAKIAYTLFIISFCGVDCFALISGYVGWNSKVRPSRIALLWVQTFFYSVIITSIFCFIRPEVVTLDVWKNSLLPITSNEYWYVTAYFGMMFFVPLINAGIKDISKKNLEIMLLVAFFAASVIPWIFKMYPYGLSSGYSVIWLCIMYVAGAYIGKYGISEKFKKWQLLATCAISAFATFMGYRRQLEGLIEYTSPTIIVFSVAFFMLCVKLKIDKDSLLGKIILFLAPSALSVFLIHVHPLIYSEIIAGSSWHFVQYGLVKFVLCIIAYVSVIYLACIVIDLVRRVIWKLTGKCVNSIKGA